MKVFLVGGAIRDELLGIPFNEKDWVVVNSSHKEMLKPVSYTHLTLPTILLV